MDPSRRGLPSVPAGAAALGPSQVIRKAVLTVAIVVGIALWFVGHSRWPNGGWVHESIEGTGLGLIVLCILGRTWCMLYIGGRKNQSLVMEGPYSITRNPLYFFSIVGAVGVGAQTGSLLAAAVCGFVAWTVFLWTACREEAALTAAFGDSYTRYLSQVPRFLPKFSLWHGPAQVLAQPRILLMTFVDALVFLVAVPLAEVVEYLQEIGVLPVYLLVP
jgi:protein-S-isoprenylcysteine O-methyltransferase Ste14